MNDYLTKTIWVMCSYGAQHLAWGLASSVLIVIYASRRKRLGVIVSLLIVATLTLWIAAFIAADSGYRAWQSSPNPPPEAFADTGPILFLVAGWIPSSGFVYLLLDLCRRSLPRPPVLPPSPPSHAA
jgi:4-hydroxybenzoate polyprenyltransferase